MPIGKDIHKQLSKRSGARKERLNKIVAERMKVNKKPVEPPTVDQFTKNVVARAKSNSIHILELAGVGRRHVSPNEGMPAVNMKSGEEVVRKAVTKVLPKVKEVDPAAGAILPTDTKKSKNSTSRKKAPRLCSGCNKAGHTKRSCPETL